MLLRLNETEEDPRIETSSKLVEFPCATAEKLN